MTDQAQTTPGLNLPEELLLEVFKLLPLHSVRCISLTCSHFSRVTRDEQLWKTMFQRDFKVPQSVPLRPKASSWRAEYRRLYDESPAVLCEEVLGHEDEVLHVSFSNNGKMFATCAKDGTVKVWNSTKPCTMHFTADMTARFTWRFTRSSEFNNSGTLLLVVGVLPRGQGEVAVFDLEQDFRLVSRSFNTPHTLYSAWYDDSHHLTGTFHWSNPFEFISAIWLAKASRTVTSERKYAMINPFRFNKSSNGCPGRILVANVNIGTGESQSIFDKPSALSAECGHGRITANSTETHAERNVEISNDSSGSLRCAQLSVLSTQEGTPSVSKHQSASAIPGYLPTEKLLICTLSKDTYYGHVVGIKRMTEEELREEEQATEGLQWPETEDGLLPDTDRDMGGSGRVSEVDYTFNMHGKIVGMALSPDQRYLYVNRRSWPNEYEIVDVTDPPPISHEVDIHVIDLVTFTKSDSVLRSHKAYTSNADCFYLYLDASELYVVSGSEDNQGYMWDRHYGVHVRCFPHDNVVGSCAFNSADPEMLVTVSDDMKIKIWRSRRQMREVTEKKKVYKYETATPATVADKNCLEGGDNFDTLSG